MQRRLQPPGAPQQLLIWSYAFEAGELRDPALSDGTLEPGERFAVRIAPVKQVTFSATPNLEVATTGATGSLVASDRRVVLLDGATVLGGWVWEADVSGVTSIHNGRGVLWSPSARRHAEGARRLEGLVVPAYTSHLDRVTRDEVLAGMLQFMKVQVAWRAGQPGGIAAWREEFTAKNADLLDR
ncbi:MAG: hypothetical protein ABSA40_10885 [Candidatus Dormibacteria bacterium]